jgi:hypothetical protein
LIYKFQDRLAFSRGKREQSDIETLKSMIYGCASVRKTDIDTDKKGIDYIVTLHSGVEIFIDAKARSPGASKYWKDEPEVALEIWSVVDKKVGWTLDQSKQTDFILFTFDPVDTDECWLVSFQLLRTAFSKNCGQWKKEYKLGKQDSGAWQSQCVFVPVSEVEQAIIQISHHTFLVDDLQDN